MAEFSRAVIFANGEVENLEAVRRLLRPDDTRIAADGGLRHLEQLGLDPHLLIGDLDSASPEAVDRLVSAGIPVERYPVAKDETDLELAILHAAKAGYRDVLIVGALGGRVDQTLGNLFLLTDPRFAGLRLRLDDGCDEVALVRDEMVIDGEPGDRVSLLPAGGDAQGVTTNQLAFPLDDEALLPYRTRGISNRMLGRQARISLRSGTLFCIHTRNSICNPSSITGKGESQ